uniref:Uncharacterized protein n=1 Tax=Anguilla anguilla TaxID=7936 RepID=A0A0E9UW64_ANGAN
MLCISPRLLWQTVCLCIPRFMCRLWYKGFIFEL